MILVVRCERCGILSPIKTWMSRLLFSNTSKILIGFLKRCSNFDTCSRLNSVYRKVLMFRYLRDAFQFSMHTRTEHWTLNTEYRILCMQFLFDILHMLCGVCSLFGCHAVNTLYHTHSYRKFPLSFACSQFFSSLSCLLFLCFFIDFGDVFKKHVFAARCWLSREVIYRNSLCFLLYIYKTVLYHWIMLKMMCSRRIIYSLFFECFRFSICGSFAIHLKRTIRQLNGRSSFIVNRLYGNSLMCALSIDLC